MSKLIDGTKNTLKEFYEIAAEVERQGVRKLEDPSWTELTRSFGLEPCRLHPLKQAPKCRVCKSLGEQLQVAAKAQDAEKQIDSVKNSAALSFFKATPLTELNSLLLENVLADDYYKKTLKNLQRGSEVVSELRKNFDTFSPWVSSRKGIASKFWSCLVRLIEIRPSIEKVSGYFSDASESHVFILLLLFLRFCLQPAFLFEQILPFFANPKKIKYKNDRISVQQFAVELIQAYKFEGIILPDFPLVDARKINWQLDCYAEKQISEENGN